jgi:hypothetical protein
VHEPHVGGPTTQTVGVRVFSSLAGCDEHLGHMAHESHIFLKANLVLQADESLETFLYDSLGHLISHTCGRSARTRRVLERKSHGKSCNC